MIRAVLLDLAGVVYQGEQPLPGAVQAIASLRNAGFRLRFLTNTTRMPRRALLSRLNSMGIAIADDELFTPAQAACAWLAAKGLSAHLLIHPALQEDFANLPASGPEAVVIGDAADGFTYAALNEAFRKLLAGAAFLALARNRSFKDEDGELSLDTGAFVAALEYATQREAVLLGKPAPDFFQCRASQHRLRRQGGGDGWRRCGSRRRRRAGGRSRQPPSSSAPANTVPVTRARQSLPQAKRSQTLQPPPDGSWSAALKRKGRPRGRPFVSCVRAKSIPRRPSRL